MLHRRIMAVVVLVVVISSPFLPLTQIPKAEAHVTTVQIPLGTHVMSKLIDLALQGATMGMTRFMYEFSQMGITVINEGLQAEKIAVRLYLVAGGVNIVFIGAVGVVVFITATGYLIFLKDRDYPFVYADALKVEEVAGCDAWCYLDKTYTGVPAQSEPVDVCMAHACGFVDCWDCWQWCPLWSAPGDPWFGQVRCS
jgi:hypothetical protein